MQGEVAAGVATFSFTPSPVVGIHTLDAHYSGDASNEASDSGQQTTVVTGSTTIEISASSGSISVPMTLGVTLN